jgi:hypothetical protein
MKIQPGAPMGALPLRPEGAELLRPTDRVVAPLPLLALGEGAASGWAHPLRPIAGISRAVRAERA